MISNHDQETKYEKRTGVQAEKDPKLLNHALSEFFERLAFLLLFGQCKK